MSYKEFVLHDREVCATATFKYPLAPTTPLGIGNICSASGPENSNHTKMEGKLQFPAVDPQY